MVRMLLLAMVMILTWRASEMKVTLRNFGKFTHFERSFDTDCVNEIFATNGAGKSTLATALAFAFCPKAWVAMSVPQRKKFQCRDSDAGVRVTVELGSKQVAEFDIKGAAAAMDWNAHPAAVGFLRLSTMSPKDVLRECAELIQPDYESAIDSYFADTHGGLVDRFRRDLDSNGGRFDVLEDSYAADLRAGKQIWSRITGEVYGSVKAAAWLPSALVGKVSAEIDALRDEKAAVDSEIAEMEIDSLKGAVTRGEIMGRIADDEKVVVRRADLIVSKTAASKKFCTAAAVLDKEQKRLAALDEKIGKLKLDSRQRVLKCPSCKASLTMAGGKLIAKDVAKAAAAAVKSLAIAQEAWKLQNVKVQNAAVEKSTLEQRLLQIESDVARTDDAAARLARNKTLLEGLPQLDNRSEVRALRDKVKLIQTAIEARTEDGKLGDVTNLLAAAKPDGIRALAMRDSIKEVNDFLVGSNCCIGEDGSVSCKGVPIARASTGERYLCDAMFARTAAELTNSPVVVFDGIEVLDEANRKLFDDKVAGFLRRGGKVVIVMGVGSDLIENGDEK